MHKLDIAFAGSPKFAAAILQALINASLTPTLVITQPDRPKGRGRHLQPNPVKQLAQQHDLPIWQPDTLKGEAVAEQLSQHPVDLLVVAAYGLILPAAVLNWPKMTCLNVHASLLPRWRGAAPIERAIMAGDQETGVAIMQMEAGVDTGPVYQQQPVNIDATQPADDLVNTLAELGGQLLVDVIRGFANSVADQTELPQPTPQTESGITYADKLSAADRQVNWHQAAEVIERQIRALAGRLAVRAEIGGLGMQLLEAEVTTRQSTGTVGQLVQIDENGLCVKTATQDLRITSVKVNGKPNALNARQFWQGYAGKVEVGMPVL